MIQREYHWRDSMRLRAGLLWRSDYPTPRDYPAAMQCTLLLLLVFILWAWAMERDFAEQQRYEADRQAAIAERRANELGECVQGSLKLSFENESDRGYSKTVIRCMPAEQFDY
jgi:hypothetical protein